MKKLGITFLVILGLLMGGQTGAIAAEGITASGFLDDYDLLKPDARVFGTYIYRSEDVSPGKYNKMIIAPVEIWLDPKSHRGVNPASLKELVDGMKDVFVQTLSGTVQLTDEPGTGVMVLRMAITNVNARTPNIDRLASSGLVFNRAYLSEAMCQPCRAELFSGQYPLRNGCAWNHSASRPTTSMRSRPSSARS